MENFVEMAYVKYMNQRAAKGLSLALPIVFTQEEFDILQQCIMETIYEALPWGLHACITEMVAEVIKGDNKYGPHPGPKRAFGALRNEFNELMTELDAEDANADSIYKEALQVWAMAYKFIRDYAGPALVNAHMPPPPPEMKTSKEWLLGMNGLSIMDPDGWDRTNFFWSFNTEEITLEEFLQRVRKSTVNASKEWRAVYGITGED